MALASGNVVYCLSVQEEYNDNLGFTRQRLVYTPATLDDEVRLVDRYWDTTVAVTDHDIFVLDNAARILRQYDLHSLTEHRPVQLVMCIASMFYILTSGGTILYSFGGEVRSIDTGLISITRSQIPPHTDIYGLTPTGIILGIAPDMDNNRLVVSIMRNASLEIGEDMFRLLVLGAPIGWNERSVIISRRVLTTTIYEAGDGDSLVVKCARLGDGLYVLYDNGEVREIRTQYPYDYTGIVVARDCINMCSIDQSEGEEVSALIGSLVDGRTIILAGVENRDLPSDITVMAGDMYIPGRRIKGAVN